MEADAYIEALGREKDGYKAAGKTERVKEVDAEIARVKKAGAVTPSPREKAVAADAETTTAK